MTPFEACLHKLAEVTQEDAERALQRLQSLEQGKPTPAQMARSAVVGALASPVASNMSKLISTGGFHTPREIAGQVAGGLVFGTAVPFAKQQVESRAERSTLRDYVNNHRGRLARRIETTLEPT